MNANSTKGSYAIQDVSWRRRLLLSFPALGCLLTALAPLAAEPDRLADLRGVFRASFNHDGSHVIVHPRMGDVGIWEISTGTRIAGDLGPNKASDTYVMSADAKMVLVGFKDGHSRVFDATTAKAISPMLDVSVGGSPAVFSPDGETLLIFAKKEAAVFNSRSGKRVATIALAAGPNEDEPCSAAFADGGAQCFLMDGSGTVTRYDTKEWKPIGKPMPHPVAEFSYGFWLQRE
jgi:WD40 repeat protein